MKLTSLAAIAAIMTTNACSADTARVADSTNVAVDSAAAMMPPPPPPPAQAVPAATSGGMLDPNAATTAELTAIPGVTSAIATALAAGRPYTSMTAVDKILAASLSEQQRDSVYARLWKPISLNTATAAEIMLIPGVGARMRHEFEEYRPYDSIEKFRREIGKYVDKTEVARLEKYVTL